IFALLTSAGPTGAFSVSHHSQKNRLEKLLVKNGILMNGKVVKAVKPVSDSDETNISSILHYMDEAHAINMLQPWFNRNIDSMHGSSVYYSAAPDSLCQIMGITYQPYNYYYSRSNYKNNSVNSNFELTADNRYFKAGIDVKGYDYYNEFSFRYYQSDQAEVDTTRSYDYFMTGNDSVYFIPYKVPCKYGLVKRGKTIAVMELSNFISSLRSASDSNNGVYSESVPASKFMYDLRGTDSVLYHFRFKSIEVYKLKDKYTIQTIEAILLTRHL
ncbi:MAG TPA: hypothetical protein VK809_09515, partial [Bacteroidia bacterium]|nr:hypothetical protein [Bacteroidia bacterium]